MAAKPSCKFGSDSRRSISGEGQQRGVALIVILILTTLITLTAVVFSLGTSTELKIAHNDLLGRQAMAVAEAGINHAIVVIAPSAADDLGLDEELGNTPTGGLSTLGTQTAIVENGVSYNYRCVPLAGTSAASTYCVRGYDNFDEKSGADAPADDIDNAIYLRSRGTAGNALRIVDVMVGISIGPDCAILTQGNLQIPGSPSITGSKGCVHTNKKLEISGNPVIEKGGTASDPPPNGIEITGNPTMEGVLLNTNALKDQYEADHDYQQQKPIPSVRPQNFGPNGIRLHEHVMNHPRGFRLDADGNIYVGPGYTGGTAGSAWVCTENPANCTGGRALTSGEKSTLQLDTWKHEDKNWGGNSHNDQWISDKDYVVPGVYLIEGSAILSKSWGTTTTPWRATIIAFNSIQMPGKPFITPYQQSTAPSGAGYVTSASPLAQWTLRNILLISGNDIEINGDAASNNFSGGMFAHQQIKVNGNPTVLGFMIAEDGLTTWAGDGGPNCNSDLNLLCDPDGNAVSGNPNINFSGLGSSLFPDKIVRVSWNDVQ